MRHTFILKYFIIIISFFMIGNLKAQTSLATNRRQGICTSLRSGHSQAFQGGDSVFFRNGDYQRLQDKRITQTELHPGTSAQAADNEPL